MSEVLMNSDIDITTLIVIINLILQIFIVVLDAWMHLKIKSDCCLGSFDSSPVDTNKDFHLKHIEISS